MPSITMKLVNTKPTHAVTTEVEIHGAFVDANADWEVMTADSLETHNNFATPDAIRPRREIIRAGDRFQVSLPPRSVSVIVMRAMAAAGR
jgi:alpha-L-arabinofuranosidase